MDGVITRIEKNILCEILINDRLVILSRLVYFVDSAKEVSVTRNADQKYLTFEVCACKDAIMTLISGETKYQVGGKYTK